MPTEQADRVTDQAPTKWEQVSGQALGIQHGNIVLDRPYLVPAPGNVAF